METSRVLLAFALVVPARASATPAGIPFRCAVVADHEHHGWTPEGTRALHAPGKE